MAFHIFPSEMNVGFVQSGSLLIPVKQAREQCMLPWMVNRGKSPKDSFVLSGFTLSVIPGSLAVNVAAGEAIVNGRWVRSDSIVTVGLLAANRSLSVTAWTPNFIWLDITTNAGGQATGGTITHNTTGTAPQGANSLLIGVTDSDTDDVLNVANAAAVPNVQQGSYTATSIASATDAFIFIGFTPKLVKVFGRYTSAGSSPASAHAMGFSPGASGFGFNTLEGRTNTAYQIPLVTTHGFVVRWNDNGTDDRGFYLNGEVYDWIAYA